jgi:hypothetical protein
VYAESGKTFIGKQKASWLNGRIVFNGKLYDGLFFEPVSHTASFDLRDVTIGIDFHWQRKEDQRFRGALNIVAQGDKIIAINRVNVEEYLASVISSEMSATASVEFLKVHAIISRSWLLSRIYTSIHSSDHQTAFRTNDETVCWYDREDLYHTVFDLTERRPWNCAVDDRGNLEIALPARREGKPPETYNYIGGRSSSI